MSPRPLIMLAILAFIPPAIACGAESPLPAPEGAIRVEDHVLADNNGPFLALGISYFTALWRCKYDRPRLESDLGFLGRQGFNYIRVFSMVGHNISWDGLEIAPVAFTNHEGRSVPAWPDYWQQFRDLIDIAYTHGLRTQITIFADAQLMREKSARMDHVRKLLDDVLPGREQKIILVEVANEAWQNGFPGPEGVADLRAIAAYLGEHTSIPIAITSNHDMGEGTRATFELLYKDRIADIATWHFSRDRHAGDGWQPVYDCWDLADLPNLPPVSSNEPIGPGASVNTESTPIRLVSAAAFAYMAKLPMYVFHCEAGVHGKSTFEKTPAIHDFTQILRLLPPDLPNWQRNNGKDASAPFTAFADDEPDTYSSEKPTAATGCIRNIGSRKDDLFLCLPIGIRPGGLRLQARHNLEVTVLNPITGESLDEIILRRGEFLALPQGPGALLLKGRILP